MHDETTEVLRLASADNFRDVAGPGHRVTGGRLRTGWAYRSNELTLTDEDVADLARLGVGAVYDLREGYEVVLHPDVAVPGATWTHAPVPGIPTDRVPTLASAEEGQSVMEAIYAGFVTDPTARAGFGAVLAGLASADGVQVFHCTAGKDRTGWVSVLLHRLAGLDEPTILAEYLATNEVSSATRAKYLGMVAEHLGEHAVPAFERVMVADATYLAAADAALAATYGDLQTYLADGLGLTPDTVAALRTRLVAVS